MKISAFSLFAFLFVFGYGCKEDDELMGDDDMTVVCDDPTNPDCPNYDPCYSAVAADASFVVLDSLFYGLADEGFPYPGFAVETDTTWNRRPLYFRANNENASYEWLIGADPTVRTGREISLHFGYMVTGNITIRLITTVAEDTTGCLSAAQLRDTSYQTVHFIDQNVLDEPTPDDATSIFGKFRGSLDTDPSYVFDIEMSSRSVPENNYAFGVVNLPEGCAVGEEIIYTYRHFMISNPPIHIDCDSPLGYGFVSPGGHNITIVFDTRVYDTQNQEWQPRSEEMTFTGERL